MKRLHTIPAILCLAVALAAAAFAAPCAFATGGPYVIDEYGIFSSSQSQALEAQADELADDYNIGVYLLVTDDIGSSTARSYAKQYYQSHDLGVGSLKGGILFLIAVDSRDYVTITYGDGGGATIPNAGGVDAFTDARVQNMENDILAYLRNNDWYGASKTYYDDAQETLEYLAANGEPMNNYRIDYSGYQDLPDYESDDDSGPFSFLLGLLSLIGIPGIVAGGTVSREKRAMKTAKEAREADNYLKRNSLKLSAKDDQFINTTVTVAPIPRHDDSDHDSGSGGMFGGGFGGFGSSSIDSGGFGGSHGGKF